MPTPMLTYEVQIQNLARGDAEITAGGSLFVAKAGSPDRETIYDPNTGLAISGLVPATRGKFTFATLASVASVDLFGIDAAGRAIVYRGAKPGAPSEIWLSDAPHQVAIVPFSIADATANTEKDTGLDMPALAQISPFGLGAHVTAADSGITVNLGLLSSGTGGDADGFLVAASVAATGMVPGVLVGTDTLGALLKEDTNAASVLVPKCHVFTGSNTRRITYTLSASADTAKGYFQIPYIRALTG